MFLLLGFMLEGQYGDAPDKNALACDFNRLCANGATFAFVVVRADLGAPHRGDQAHVERIISQIDTCWNEVVAGALVRLLGGLQEIRCNLAHASLHVHDRWFPHCHLDLLRQDPAPSWASRSLWPSAE